MEKSANSAKIDEPKVCPHSASETKASELRMGIHVLHLSHPHQGVNGSERMKLFAGPGTPKFACVSKSLLPEKLNK